MKLEKVSTYYIPTLIKYLECLKEEPLKYTEPICNQQRNYVLRSYDWFINNYIIDLNQKIDFNLFSYKNLQYMYTPKIYKIHDNLFVEKSIPNCSITKAYRKEEVLKILKSLLDINIGIDLESLDITVSQQKEFKKIKFNRFYFDDCGGLDIIDYYYTKLNKLYEYK